MTAAACVNPCAPARGRPYHLAGLLHGQAPHPADLPSADLRRLARTRPSRPSLQCAAGLEARLSRANGGSQSKARQDAEALCEAAQIRRLNGRGQPRSSRFQLRRIGAAHALERAVGASAAMDGESEADTQRAEAWRAEANVKREGVGSHEPARFEKRQAKACPTGRGRIRRTRAPWRPCRHRRSRAAASPRRPGRRCRRGSTGCRPRTARGTWPP